MKVRITFTIEVDDDERRVINNHYGKKGLADRDEVRSWFTRFGQEHGAFMIGDALYYETPEDEEE